MSRLPDRLPDRVDASGANHLDNGRDQAPGRDDSYVRRDASRSDLTNTPAHIGRIALDRLTQLLSDRDLAVIDSVARYRCLTGAQIERLHFLDHATKDTAARTRRRVLERLAAGRFIDQLPRQIGGVRAGSSGLVFVLGPTGYRVLHGEPRRSGAPRDGGPSTTFVAHTIAVAEVGVRLSSARGTNDVEDVTIETEPACWRTYQRGLAGTETLKPDLYVEITTAEFEDKWFVEVDRATESLTAIGIKCKTYVDYYRTGIEQSRSEVFPKVLWSVPTERRANQLRDTISRLKGAPDGLFVVALDVDTPERLLGGQP